MSRFNQNGPSRANVVTIYNGITLEDGNWFELIADNFNIVAKKQGAGDVTFEIQATLDDSIDNNLSYKTLDTVTLSDSNVLISKTYTDPWKNIKITPTYYSPDVYYFNVKLAN